MSAGKRVVLGKEDSNSSGAIVWNIFSSLRLTIFLLILLAATSVLGTLILQNGTPQQVLAAYGPELARILDFFGLFDMYHSWWFLAILALLVINLIFCSLNRLPSLWRQIFRSRIDLSSSGIQAQPYTKTFQISAEGKGLEEEIETGIHRFFGKPRRVEGSQRLLFYFERGRYGRLGVYVAHLSVIVILMGAMIGSVFGFNGFLKITEGETLDTIWLRKDGRFVDYPLGYRVRCDDFEISYYDTPGPERFVSEYTSSLSILEEGQDVYRVKVRVNHPLTHQGLRFYQSSYGNEAEIGLLVRRRRGDASFQFRVREGERVDIPDSDTAFQLLGYFPEVHSFGEGVQLALFSDSQTPQRIWLFKKIPDYDEEREGHFIFTLTDIVMRDYTVLQVTKDPGVSVVWIGSGLLIVGLMMAFFIPHRKLWVHVSRGKGKSVKVILGGNTNRNRVNFEKGFSEIIDYAEQLGLKAT
jgi:cytochrome c biogenesis protein